MRIWRPIIMSFYDHTGYVKRMEKLALKGWKVVGMNNFAWKLEKIQPRELHYAVTYFPDASEFDPYLSTKQEDYIALCEDAGWHMVGQQGQLVAFCSEDANPIPLETDAAMQVDTIHKSMKKSFLPGQITLGALALLQLFMQWYSLQSNGTQFLQNTGSTVAVLCWLMVLVLSLTDIVNYNLWYRKAKAASAEGVLLPSRSTGKFQLISLILLVCLLAAWLFCTDDAKLILPTFAIFAVLIAGLYLVKYLLKISGVEARLARVLYMLAAVLLTIFTIFLGVALILDDLDEDRTRADDVVDQYELWGDTLYVYNDALPLTMADLGIEVEDETQYSKELDSQESVFLTVYTARQVPRMDAVETNLPDLHYTMTVFKMGFVQDYYNQSLLKDYEYKNVVPVDAAPWQADAVYALAEEDDKSGTHATAYIVFWDNRTLEIYFPDVPTAEQIATTTRLLTAY